MAVEGAKRTIKEIRKIMWSTAFDLKVLAQSIETIVNDIREAEARITTSNKSELEMLGEVIEGIIILEYFAEKLNIITRKLEKTAQSIRSEYELGKKTSLPELAEQIKALVRKNEGCETWL